MQALVKELKDRAEKIKLGEHLPHSYYGSTVFIGVNLLMA